MSTHEYPKEMIDPGADTPAAPERLRSFVERMEWSGWGYDQAGEGKPKCPDCGNWQDDGHADGCGLAALLAAPVAPARVPGSGHPKRTPEQMREWADAEDAAGGVFAAGALEAPLAPAEPVAWRYVPSDVWGDAIVTQDPKTVALAKQFGREVQPLYTAPPDVPPGWVLVPAEPTQGMCAAAVRFANGSAVYRNVGAEVLKIEESIYAEVYEAMLAAAPKVPT